MDTAMLEIKNISKVYHTGSLTQNALSDVSLGLRDNEFVAVLGPSGSGKTTLLNIIGGLDRYDSGDLVINGVSTKRYSDRDWDSYRNHTVGFVFQSYNLIPHQSVLKNVELALTISGVSAAERTRRAEEALEKVGLSEHIHKNPGQLSGGQMQRVAIARALVNDPDILLADEPTGALDSETSVQVMELLKEVAADRLVVMVTHNPELADQYATRTVRLYDGRITDDSDPYTVESDAPPVHRNMGRSSMSFLTALVLSFNNLWTKKARTILVAFAGSIGIIGIALILSMSNGANNYIRDIEEESLQGYPLTINSSGINPASLYIASSSDEEREGEVSERMSVTNLLSGVTNNDLRSLRAYLESDQTDIYDYVRTIEYDYNIVPPIYRMTGDETYRQVNPDNTLSALGFGSSDSMNQLVSSYMNPNVFIPLPKDDSLYKESYELVAGEWPDSYDDCVVVLSFDNRVTDMTLYALGIRDPEDLDRMIDAFVNSENADMEVSPGWYKLDDMLGTEFRVIPASSYYTYDKKNQVWQDNSDDEDFVLSLLEDAEQLHITGVIRPAEDATATMLEVGIAYPYELTIHLSALAAESDIVKAQLADPDVNVFTGKRFDDEDDDAKADLSDIFNVDEDALQKALGFDLSDVDLSDVDLSGVDLSKIDFSAVDLSDVDPQALASLFPSLSSESIAKLLEISGVEISSEVMQELFSDLLAGYLSYAASDPSTDFSRLPQAVGSYLSSSQARSILLSGIADALQQNSRDLITNADLEAMVANVMSGYPDYLSANGLEDDGSLRYLGGYLGSAGARALMADSAAELRDKLASVRLSDDQILAITASLISGYDDYAEENALPVTSKLQSSFADYLATDSAREMIAQAVFGSVDQGMLSKLFASYADEMNTGVNKLLSGVMASLSNAVTSSLSSSLSSLSSSFGSGLQGLFNLDPTNLAAAFEANMNAEELSRLLASILNPETTSYDKNLSSLTYLDSERPSTINIYPTDYDGKTRVKEIIDDYNEQMTASGQDDKTIYYTDYVDALMSSVTTIVDVISYVLIAFVAISLVVSSIMIGVITYISVLERKKEIGILRAIGASKRNISEVFNAETFIIGTLVGVIGVLVTLLLLIPGNAILHALTGQEDIIAALPAGSAFVLILLSILLTLIGGIIPSRKAAKSDPVSALRSE